MGERGILDISVPKENVSRESFSKLNENEEIRWLKKQIVDKNKWSLQTQNENWFDVYGV